MVATCGILVMEVCEMFVVQIENTSGHYIQGVGDRMDQDKCKALALDLNQFFASFALPFCAIVKKVDH
jgi:hypothetical protein